MKYPGVRRKPEELGPFDGDPPGEKPSECPDGGAGDDLSGTRAQGFTVGTS